MCLWKAGRSRGWGSGSTEGVTGTGQGSGGISQVHGQRGRAAHCARVLSAGGPDERARNRGGKTTPLTGLHRELGARMAPFAGYDMPIRYAGGIVEEHLHTRSAASLFDVSHMGQLTIRGDGRVRALEALLPGDIQGLAPGGMRYTMLTDEAGGILDDLIVTDVGPYLFVVANAACKEADIVYIRAALPAGCVLDELDRGLVALQGPKAAAALAVLAPGARRFPS